MSFLKKTKKDLTDFFKRIKSRNFSGDLGILIKNSIYHFSGNLISKTLSFVFTIIIARMLAPDLFGLYGLTLSTILLLGTFSELGVSKALVKIVSKELKKNNKEKTLSYILYIGKIKLILISISIILIFFSAGFISNGIYNKPIYLPLIFGGFYILSINIFSFFKSILEATNNFRIVLYGKILFEMLRNVVVPITIFFLLGNFYSYEYIIFYIIVVLSFCYLLASIILIFPLRKKIHITNTKLKPKEKKEVNKFIKYTSVMVLSGLFFGHIDKLMLGKFVTAAFIGYYMAAFNLLGVITLLIGFTDVFLPAFSRLDIKKSLEGLKKARRISIFFGSVLSIIIFLLSPLIIYIIYGSNYSLSIDVLRILSPLLLILPLIGLETSYLLSIGKTKIIAKLLILSTTFNIFFNLILIYMFGVYGNLMIVIGISISTLFSQIIYLIFLYRFSTNIFKLT